MNVLRLSSAVSWDDVIHMNTRAVEGISSHGNGGM